MAELYLVALSEWPNDSIKTKAIRWFLHKFCQRCYYAGEETLTFQNSGTEYAELIYAITRKSMSIPTWALTKTVHENYLKKPIPSLRSKQTFEDFQTEYDEQSKNKIKLVNEQEEEWDKEVNKKHADKRKFLGALKWVLERYADN